jgi:M6 family metalloprotease-like protein
MSRSTLLTLLVAASFGLAACRDDRSPTEPQIEAQLDQASSGATTGWMYSLRGDPQGGRGMPQTRHELVDDQGRATELVLDQAQAARFGGHGRMHRQRVRVEGRELSPGRMQVSSLALEGGAEPAAATMSAVTRAGSYAYITIGCKFSDVAAEPHTIGTYAAWTTGTSYPGLDYYWREQSYNQINLGGSAMVGWYTLPYPRSHYVTSSGLDLQGLATDCTGAADPDVNFPQYYGINMQFNDVLDCCSWGGTWSVTADGQTRIYGMTWMANWADVATYAHEEGHSLGLPHSSGSYSQTYDSQWDVMSSASAFWDAAQSTWIPTNTISYHKDLLGWIPAARKVSVAPNSSQTITLERLAQPGSGTYLMAQIPIDNAPGQFYTVEARRKVGSYDSHIPGDAVVLHRVDPTRTDRVAQVVDVDNNGNPNDVGAQWTVGETFSDPANAITVRVNAATTTGFQVTISRGAAGPWATMASLRTARSAFALVTVNTSLYAIGGQSNGAALSSVEAYDPSADAWSTKAKLPAARYDGDGAAYLNGFVYLPGGRNGTGTLTKTLYALNVSTNTWSTKAALPVASGCGGTAAIGTVVYVLTGCDATGFKGQLHRYTPSTNSWVARAAAPAAHGLAAVGVIKGKLYVAGGKNAAGTATATLHVYDPATNQWTTKAAMPSPRFGAAGRVVAGKLYVVGGTDAAGSALAATLVYDAASNTWSTIAPMPTARTGLGAVGLNGLLYAVGGRAGSTDVTKVERLTP